jgi:hypothetical protein
MFLGDVGSDVSQFLKRRLEVYDSKDGEMLERSNRHAWKAKRATLTK